jgi:ATP-binding cassette subfamily F protein 3
MRAKDVLLEALAVFTGTVIFVSHDRYFIDRLATRVLEVEGGTVTSHEGNYEDYLRWKDAQSVTSQQNCHPERSEGPAVRASSPSASIHDPEDPPAKGRRLNPIKQKQMEERCAFLEEETPRIEAAIRHTEEQLGIFVSAAETQRLTALAEDLRGQLASLTAEWEELIMQLDSQSSAIP